MTKSQFSLSKTAIQMSSTTCWYLCLRTFLRFVRGDIAQTRPFGIAKAISCLIESKCEDQDVTRT